MASKSRVTRLGMQGGRRYPPVKGKSQGGSVEIGISSAVQGFPAGLAGPAKTFSLCFWTQLARDHDESCFRWLKREFDLDALPVGDGQPIDCRYAIDGGVLATRV